MNSIDPSLIGIVSAGTALIASVVGPMVTLYVAKVQIRAAVRSANRQKWIEEFRDTVARFAGQVAVATQIHQSIVVDGHVSIPLESHALRDFEQLIYTATRIRLLVDPLDPQHGELMTAIDTLLALFRRGPTQAGLQDDAREQVMQITTRSLAIIRAEWLRVQRGA